MKGLIIAAYGKKLHHDRLAAEHKKYADQMEQRQKTEALERAKKDRMNVLKILAKEQIEYEQIKKLKEQLENKLKHDPESKELDQALKWANEYLAEPDPLTSFLNKTIKPLLQKDNQRY